MFNKIKNSWRSLTRNEKIMYLLLLMLIIGIATRWRYVLCDIVDAFNTIFTR